MVSSGATWRNHYSFNNTLTLEYNFRAQTSTTAMVAGVQSHAASVGWTHKFSPRLGISASGGPAWSIYNEQQKPGVTNHGRTTLHGSLALSREFQRGGVVLSVSRSDGFTGIISESFHNRYEAGLHRDISSRLHWSASASYIQQQILNERTIDGELFSTQAHYYLSRNLSLFGQVRYLKISGNERIVAPETNGTIGIRWAWVPEKP
jgi:predicted porin